MTGSENCCHYGFRDLFIYLFVYRNWTWIPRDYSNSHTLCN